MIAENDPAGMGIAFTNVINRYSEHSCRLVTIQERYGINFESDIHVPDIEDDDFGEIESILRNADIIHFHMLKDEHSHIGPLVIRDYIKGKKIIHHHHGHPDYLINVDKYNEKYRKLKRKVIVSTPDLLRVAENSIWIPNIVPIYDVQFQPRFEESLQDDKVIVCQSPTRKFHKHTSDFLYVMSELKKKYNNLETLIIEKTPYFKCLDIKKRAHIVFDHMRGWFGIASLESLSQGKPVVAGLDDWNIQCIKEFTGTDEQPWVIARDKNGLRTELEKLIKDKDLRNRIGKQSRYFIEKHWTEQHVLKLLLDVYCSL